MTELLSTAASLLALGGLLLVLLNARAHGLVHLASAHALHHGGRTLLLVGCVGLALAVPLSASRVAARFSESLRARAEATPLLVGPEASRFELLFAGLNFRRPGLDPITVRTWRELDSDPSLLAIPLHVRFTAQGAPVVGTTPEYLEQRGLAVAAGTPPLLLGDALLGARLARRLGLAPGDAFFSDARDVYDVATQAPLQLTASGVLAPTGSDDDDVVFVDLSTAFALEGLIHGHADAARAPEEAPETVLGEVGDHVAMAPGLIETAEPGGETLGGFHLHGDEADAPLSVVLVFPADERARTIAESRMDARPGLRAIRPAEVSEELIAFAFRVKALFDAVGAMLVVSTAALVALVLALSARARRAEFTALHRLGCRPGTVPALIGLELGGVLFAGAVLASFLAVCVEAGFVLAVRA